MVAKEMGVQAYSSWYVPQRDSEDKHEPHNDILLEYGVPRQRADRPGQYWCPLAQRPAVHVYAVPHDLYGDQGHRVLSLEDLGGDRDARAHPAGPWLSPPGHRHRLRLRRAN